MNLIKNNNSGKNNDKRQGIIWSLIIIATVLISIIIIWLILGDNFQNDKNDKKTNQDTTRKIGLTTSLNPRDLLGDYTGVKESIDGSIEAIVLRISLSENESTFDLLLNIGVNKKIKGKAIVVSDKLKIDSDILGSLSFEYDSNGRINLTSNLDGSNTKYKLIKE